MPAHQSPRHTRRRPAAASTSGVPRLFSVIRALTAVQAEGGRVTQLARPWA
jgi:hypothetical protein